MNPRSTSSLEARVARLEARHEIRELVARYCFTVDARDIEGIAACFTRDGAMRSLDGVMDARGRDAVVNQFHGRFEVLGPSNHFTHDHLIEFDADDPDRATGIVNSHAEVVRNGRALLASLRYHDEYRREDGSWRFHLRLLSFFYYLEPGEYAAVLRDPLRNRAYAEPRPADFPERLDTWQRYHREHASGR